jgi:hypothetical protein
MVIRTVAVVTGVLAVATLSAQQRPTFRSGVSTVSIYATVRAADGRLVTDLTKDDFEIHDEGKVRDVTVFSSESVPITVTMMLDMSGSRKSASNGCVMPRTPSSISCCRRTARAWALSGPRSRSVPVDGR